MPRIPERNWLLTDEVADLLGVSSARIRQMLAPETQRILFPHSVLIRKIWLHYKGDVMKLKELYEKNPPRVNRNGGRPRKKPSPEASNIAQSETTSGAGNIPEQGEN